MNDAEDRLAELESRVEKLEDLADNLACLGLVTVIVVLVCAILWFLKIIVS